MSKHKKKLSHYVEALSEDAQALLAATSDVAEDKVRDARKKLASALDSGKEIYDLVRDKASRGVRYADESVHENPYAPIAAAFVLGVFVTLLLTRRSD